MVKNPPARTGDTGDMSLISGQEDLLEKEMATPLQYSCLENPMDPGGLQSHGVAESDTTE